jgi:hypothetical protein
MQKICIFWSEPRSSKKAKKSANLKQFCGQNNVALHAWSVLHVQRYSIAMPHTHCQLFNIYLCNSSAECTIGIHISPIGPKPKAVAL